MHCAVGQSVPARASVHCAVEQSALARASVHCAGGQSTPARASVRRATGHLLAALAPQSTGKKSHSIFTTSLGITSVGIPSLGCLRIYQRRRSTHCTTARRTVGLGLHVPSTNINAGQTYFSGIDKIPNHPSPKSLNCQSLHPARRLGSGPAITKKTGRPPPKRASRLQQPTAIPVMGFVVMTLVVRAA